MAAPLAEMLSQIVTLNVPDRLRDYSFETSRIKDPLFAWLQSHGWQHKGLLGKFFAHLGPVSSDPHHDFLA